MEDNEWVLKKEKKSKKERDVGEFHLESCKDETDGDI